MLLQKPQRGGAADAGSSGAVPPPEQRHRARVAGCSIGGLSQKQQRAKNTATVEGGKEVTPQKHRQRGDRSENNPESSAPSIDSSHHGTAAKDCAKKKQGMSSVVKILHGRNKDVALIGKVQPNKVLKDSSGERPQKHQAEQETVPGATGISVREEPPNSSKSHAKVHLDLQEADDEIQKLNQLGLGEDISPDEFLNYFNQLPDEPSIDLYTKLDNKLLTPLYERHARYRLKYLKVHSIVLYIQSLNIIRYLLLCCVFMLPVVLQLSQNASKDKLEAELKKHNALDLLEKDFSQELLSKMRYFAHFERDGSLDWFFDPELCKIEALDDYQRLIVRNHVCIVAQFH